MMRCDERRSVAMNLRHVRRIAARSTRTPSMAPVVKRSCPKRRWDRRKGSHVMKAKRFPRGLAVSVVAAFLVWGLSTSRVSASHSWSDFHWARTANPFTVKLVRKLTTTWRPYLDLGSAAWTTASKLNTTIIAGLSDSLTRQACAAEAGRIVVCNYPYGLLGWTGLATIWFDANHHITQATAKMNDSYSWNPGSRQLVMCQEVGHGFGLGHQDEVFGNPNLGSCMDYTNAPFGPPNNLALNQHDHDQLNLIYAHLDAYTTLTALPLSSSVSPETASIDFNQPEEWGLLVESSNDGRTEAYVRTFSDGSGVATFVIRVKAR